MCPGLGKDRILRQRWRQSWKYKYSWSCISYHTKTMGLWDGFTLVHRTSKKYELKGCFCAGKCKSWKDLEESRSAVSELFVPLLEHISLFYSCMKSTNHRHISNEFSLLNQTLGVMMLPCNNRNIWTKREFMIMP